MSRRRRSRFLLVLLLAASLVVSIEGAVRLRQWLRYGVTSDDIHNLVEDPVSGLRVPRPGVIVSRLRQIQVNELGFRGPALEAPKPAGRLRVAFLGGSTTFCAEATRDETTWPWLTAEGLGARFPDVPVDHINAGVAGYTTTTSLRNLERRVVPHSPDLIVIYHASNDLLRETRAHAERLGLRSRDSFGPSWLAQRSLAWLLIEKTLAGAMHTDEGADDERFAFAPSLHAERFQRDLDALVVASQAAAPVVALVTFSHKARSDQPAAERIRNCESSLQYMPYLTADEVITGIASFNDVIRDVARGRGAVLIEGEELIPGDDVHFFDSIHLTDAGCALQAERAIRGLADAPAVRALFEEVRIGG